MSESLRPSIVRTEWARRYVQELEAVKATWIGSKADKLTHEFNEHSRELELIWVPEPIDQGVEKMGLLIGDAVHNLRAALDMLIHALHVREGIERPEKLWPQPKFPIYVDAAAYDTEGVELVKALSEPLRNLIRIQQPHTRGDGAEQDPLTVLHRLSNAEKHRVITPVLLGVHEGTKPVLQIPDEIKDGIETLYLLPGGATLKPNTPVARLRLSQDLIDRDQTINVTTTIKGDIAFEDGSLILDSLDYMAARVEGIVKSFVGLA